MDDARTELTVAHKPKTNNMQTDSRVTRLGPGQLIEERVREDAVEVGAEQDPAQVEGRQAQGETQRL